MVKVFRITLQDNYYPQELLTLYLPVLCVRTQELRVDSITPIPGPLTVLKLIAMVPLIDK